MFRRREAMMKETARLTKRLIAVTTAVVTLGSFGVAAAEPAPREDRKTVRTGSILGGFFVAAGDRGPDCFETPDCRVWLESDCDPALTAISDLPNAYESDPALYTSIVDVRNLAGLREKRLLAVGLSGGYGVGWGGITVQFWNADCYEIDEREFASQRTAEAGRLMRFKIRRGVKWMTLAAWDTMRLDWTLW